MRFFKKKHRGKAVKKEPDATWTKTMCLCNRMIADKMVTYNLSIVDIAKELGIGHTTLRQYLFSFNKAPTAQVRLRIEEWIRKNQKV